MYFRLSFFSNVRFASLDILRHIDEHVVCSLSLYISTLSVIFNLAISVHFLLGHTSLSRMHLFIISLCGVEYAVPYVGIIFVC